MKLGFGLNFAELENLAGITKLHHIFLEFAKDHGFILPWQLTRQESASFNNLKEESSLLLELAPILDDFLAQLFGIEREVNTQRQQHKDFDIIYECKRKFVQRVAVKKYQPEQLLAIDFAEISAELAQLLGDKFNSEIFAKSVMAWLEDEEKYALQLDLAARYAAYMVHFFNHSSGAFGFGTSNFSSLFNLPSKIDQNNKISSSKIERYKAGVRYGFEHVNHELNLDNALSASHYCIYCHNQQKDSCSKGLKINENLNKNGCPLKQKISEMNYVKSKGFNLGALAIIVIDNPMVAATGYRICNDCSNACIYQKQDPVDIPLTESNILQTVLDLPYGFEIYYLLTRWNPLNFSTPLPKTQTGYNILVAGLGPAGFSISYYLMQEGHNIVAIDGQKIMPLDFDIAAPIKYISQHINNSGERAPMGFGGVAEYGITARWNKHNLTIIRLILERQKNYKYYSGVSLGSNITPQQASALGFDHLALCTGAGAPKLAKFPNFLALGVKTASDFLMNLQLGGAFLKNSSTNLLIRMPVVVIGLGLTAVDTAVEALNYYPVQVKKFLQSYENLSEEEKNNFTAEDQIIASEFIAHAKLFQSLNDPKAIRKAMIEQLGGVTICYRGDIKNSPAYLLNPEEIMHAMAAGVIFEDNMKLKRINVDEYAYCSAVEFDSKTMPAKTVLMAIGTETSRPEVQNALKQDYIPTSLFGDANPSFAGSVVKALASSKYGYKEISATLSERKQNFSGSFKQFTTRLDDALISTVKEVNLLSENIVELIIRSPLAARNFKPGQFFKLQAYDLPMEPLALTGAYVDEAKGLISLIVLEVGNSTKLCRNLKIGSKIVLMGPNGAPTEIVKDQNVILIGGGLGNVLLFSIGKALRQNGCKVLYIAGYKKSSDRFYQDKIEAAADQVIWCFEEGENNCEETFATFDLQKKKEIYIHGNVIDGLKYVTTSIFDTPDRIIAIGSNKMMKAVSEFKQANFSDKVQLICSINSLMQCMMKGICGQCVQAVTTNEGYIFTCICQDQSADIVDFENLTSRLKQNSVQEKLYQNSF